MFKRVLNVGQCNPDHASLSRFLIAHFDVEVDRAHELEDTIDKLRTATYDLVMINRKLDIDYSDGMSVLRAIKADKELHETPVMIISNYEDAQAAARAEGAVPGFGKAELNDPASLEKVSSILGATAAS